MNTITLLGGNEFEVAKLDGTREKVFVRQIPVREMPKYLAAQDDEPAMIELVCKVRPEFVDALHPDSHEALVAEIERVNNDFFTRWGHRQKERGERLQAEFVPNPAPESGCPLSPSPTSPPKSPSSAA